MRDSTHCVSAVIQFNLHDTTSALASRTRDCLERWDIQRAKSGEDGWDVILSQNYVMSAGICFDLAVVYSNDVCSPLSHGTSASPCG